MTEATLLILGLGSMYLLLVLAADTGSPTTSTVVYSTTLQAGLGEWHGPDDTCQ